MKKFLAIGGAVLALFGVSRNIPIIAPHSVISTGAIRQRASADRASRLTEQDFRFQLPNGRDCGDAASYLASHQNGSSYSSGSGGGYFGGHGLGGAHFGGFGHAGSGVHGGS